MNFEIQLNVFSTGMTSAAQRRGPLGLISVQPAPAHIKQVVELYLATYPPSVPTGRLRDKREVYAQILRSAFAWGKSHGGIEATWMLARKYHPSKGNPKGGWDPIDGVSIEVYPVTDATLDRIKGEFAYFLSISSKLAANSAMRSCTWVLQNDRPNTAYGVSLFLSHSRSEVHAGVVGPPHRTALAVAPAGEGSLLHAEFVQQLQVGGSIQVQWTFSGDPPHIRHLVWWTDLDAPVFANGAEPGSAPLSIPRGDEAMLDSFARTRQAELELRNAYSADGSRPHAAHRAFFADLDQRTLPAAGTSAPVDLVSGYLRSRYLVRAEDAGFGQLPEFSQLEVEQHRGSAEGIADLLEEILITHYQGKHQGLDYDQVARGFMLFAGGQLTEFDTHGAPNGVNFFSFCEFAILLLELDYHAEFWGPLVPIFARAAEVFARCYHKCNGPRSSCAYRVTFNPVGARGFNDDELDELKQHWSRIDPIEGFSRIVHAALEHEVYRGPVAAFDLVDHGCRTYLGAGPRRPALGAASLRSMPKAGVDF
ncbi:MAG: hypothetical protein R3F49_06025 [Planctomycetota bacterium]